MIKKILFLVSVILSIILILVTIAFYNKANDARFQMEEITRQLEINDADLDRKRDNFNITINRLDTEIKSLENELEELEGIVNEKEEIIIQLNDDKDELIEHLKLNSVVMDTIFYDYKAEIIENNDIDKSMDNTFQQLDENEVPMSHRETGALFIEYALIWEEEAQKTYDELILHLVNNQVSSFQEYYESWKVAYQLKYCITSEMIYNDEKNSGGYSFWVFVELQRDRVDEVRRFTLFLKELYYLQTDEVIFYYKVDEE